MARKSAHLLPSRQKAAQRVSFNPLGGQYREYIKRVFATYYGNAPWTCHFCNEVIDHEGNDAASLDRHHINGDRTDNSMGNLVPSHKGCHTSHHHRGKVKPRVRDSETGRFLRGA